MLLNIITITKDDFEGLKKTVESTEELRAHPDVAQIVIDSSEESIKIKNTEYLDNKSNIEYFWQEPRGRSAAFNYGLDQAGGKWIWFLNGGDETRPDLDSNLLLSLLNKNNAEAIIFQFEQIQSKFIPPHPELWALWPPLLSWIPHPSTVTRKELYHRYGNFDESLKNAMDFEIWMRFFSEKVIVDLISIPIARFDQTGVSYRLIKTTRREARKIIVKYLFKVLKRNLQSYIIIIKALIKSR